MCQLRYHSCAASSQQSSQNVHGGIEQPQALPEIRASVKTPTRFASLDWSLPFHDYTLGLIAGGMDDGSILVWDVAVLLQHQEEQHQPPPQALVATVHELEGRVTALKFHPLEPWNLACGGANGNVKVLDFSVATEDDAQPPCSVVDPTGTSRQTSEINSVAWNSQVAHILASSSLDGSVGVWDLKQHKAWCKLQVEHGGVSSIAWNPLEGLYLLTASADDRSPVLKVYDLGASTSMPLTTLTGHTAGILHTSWCPHDETLLLSCAKDNRVLLWDLFKLQAIAELPSDASEAQQSGSMQLQQQQSPYGGGAGGGGTASVDPTQLFASQTLLHAQKHMRVTATWSPCKRGIALTTSLDRKVQAHSILSLATRAGRPPKWMKPVSCVSTSFGGVIISTVAPPQQQQQSQASPNRQPCPVVKIYTVPEQEDLVQVSAQFESELAQCDNPVAFCLRRTGPSWGFMSVLFHSNAREHLLQHLGFDAVQIAQAANAFTQTSPAENGLEKLSLHGNDTPNHSGSRMSGAAQALVQRALIVGNFEAAVECCWKAGNLSDALLLAYCGGADLWSQTQERYLSQFQPERPYLSLLSGIAQSQWDTLVAESNTAQWQETLAILSSYAQSEEFPRLCIALGQRLEEAGHDENASLCYMCALNVEHASRYWVAQLHAASRKNVGPSVDLLVLHELIVKVTVFSLAAAPKEELPPELSDFFTQYAQALAEQGLFATAAKYCRGSSVESKILRDRLYRSRDSQRCLAALGSPPEFPFSVQHVETSRQQPQVQSQHSSKTASSRTSRGGVNATVVGAGYGQQSQPVQSQRQGYVQPHTGSTPAAHATSAATSASSTDELPAGWVALQDPNSGVTYYANQTTGESTWDRPVAAPRVVETLPAHLGSPGTPMNDSGSVRSAASSVGSASKLSTKANLVSKYGDGFVTSASHPELADQYGNVGTSNPYTGVTRPGTAAAVLGQASPKQDAPPSGPIDLHALELEAHHAQIKDTLLALYDHLQTVSFPSERRQLEESKKGIDVLMKKLSRNSLEEETESKVLSMVGAIANHDLRTAAAIQTTLVNTDWRTEKDWLKGMKVLLQLATKKL